MTDSSYRSASLLEAVNACVEAAHKVGGDLGAAGAAQVRSGSLVMSEAGT